MNSDTFKGAWTNLKGSAKVQWGKLTDDDLLQVNGHLEKLVGLLQQRYGYARERAEQEVTGFFESAERSAAPQPNET